MRELKTLKDLEENFGSMKRVYGKEDLISTNIIREEARNWIKVLNRELKTYNIAWKLGQREFIKRFFNLEDEKE